MILKNSKSLLVVLSFVSMALLALIAFGIYDIKIKRQEVSRLRDQSDRIISITTLARSVKVIQNEVATDIKAFNGLLLVGDKLVSLIEDIEGIGRKLGLDANILSVGKVGDSQSGGPNIIRIVLETQGSWAETLSFLRTIEHLPHRVVIDELSFSKEEAAWHSRIVFSLYSFD